MQNYIRSDIYSHYAIQPFEGSFYVSNHADPFEYAENIYILFQMVPCFTHDHKVEVPLGWNYIVSEIRLYIMIEVILQLLQNLGSV